VLKRIAFLTRLCLLILLLVSTAPLLGAEQTADAEKDEDWDVLYLGQSRSGYSRTSSKTVTRGDQKLNRNEVEMYLVIKRFGQTLKMTVNQVFEETEDGELVSYEMKTLNPPNVKTVTRGRREGDQLIVTNEIAGKVSTKKLPWNPEAKSPLYQQRLLEKNPLKPGDKRTFKIFVPDTLSFSDVDIEAVGYKEIPLPGGKKPKLLKVVSTMNLAANTKIETTSYLDEQGDTLHSTVPLFGAITLSTYRVSKETALRTLAGAELDLGIDTLVKTGRIKNPHKSSKIVYRIKMDGENPLDFLVAGGTQTIKENGPHEAELTVTKADPQQAASNKSAQQPAAEFTQPTSFLQSDDPRVVEHAHKAIGEETDPWKKAILLEQYVNTHLTEKNFSTAMASAADVARDLEGDCTEHAVLLAAMARAAGIPSRIAAGLVYVERLSAFGGHMWTEVYLNGRWIPLDATLGAGGIGAAHIKLSETSMADEAPAPVMSLLPLVTALSKIKIEVVSVESD